MILLDTDHFSVITDARHARHAKLLEKLDGVDESIAIPVIAVEEQLRAWLAQIHRIRDVRQQPLPYDRLIRLIDVLAEWEIAKWDQPSAEEFLRLRKMRIRIGTQDLKIACLALINNALLLSSNLRDFERIPELHVEDWLYG